MADHDPSSSIIFFEIIVAQSLLIIIFIVYFIINKRKRSRLLKGIIVDAYENVGRRKEMLKSGISNFSSDKSETLIDQLAQKEIDFYEYIVNALHSNKNQDFEGLRASVDDLYSPYTGDSAGEEDPQESPGNDLNKEEPVIPNVDQAIDDLLDSNDPEPEIMNEEDANPELDLSDQGEIAEIPDDLLDDGSDQAKSD